MRLFFIIFIFAILKIISRYIEKFPDGLYKGKLFVFDNRYGIHINEESKSEIISKCKYCISPCDDYQLCTTAGCRQLLLSCGECRKKVKLLIYSLILI